MLAPWWVLVTLINRFPPVISPVWISVLAHVSYVSQGDSIARLLWGTLGPWPLSPWHGFPRSRWGIIDQMLNLMTAVVFPISLTWHVELWYFHSILLKLWEPSSQTIIVSIISIDSFFLSSITLGIKGRSNSTTRSAVTRTGPHMSYWS